LKPGVFFVFSDSLLHSATRYATTEVDRTIYDFQHKLAARRLEIRLRVPLFVLMNAPLDLPFEFPFHLWRLLMAPVHYVNALGHLYGLVLYWADLGLSRVLSESPTTEMVICQKGSRLNASMV